MNFNGKFWHKPGHLGMTTDEVKAALKALPTPEAGDAGKAVVVNADADGYELGTAGGGGGQVYESRIELSTAGYATWVFSLLTSTELTPGNMTWSNFNSLMSSLGYNSGDYFPLNNVVDIQAGNGTTSTAVWYYLQKIKLYSGSTEADAYGYQVQLGKTDTYNFAADITAVPLETVKVLSCRAI